MHTAPTLITLLLLATTALAQTPTLVKDINPGSANGFPNNKEYLVAIGNVVYFAADDGIHGSELWRSDGTEPGTYLVKDIQPGSVGSAPVRFNVLGEKILFIANDGTHGDELWSSDGTEAGTVLVKDINPGAGNVIRRNYLPQVRDRIVMNGVLFFAADTGPDYSQLWRTDGTEQGTIFVGDVCPGCDANNFATGEFTVLNDTLYMGAGGGLWRSDGSTMGTQQIVSAWDNGGPGSINYLTAANGLLYMSGGTDAWSYDLWVSDGTKAGTHMVMNMPETGTPHEFTALAGRVFFISDDNLWSTDGTAAGTQLESSLVVENVFQRKSNLFLWNNELYYRAKAADGNIYLYKTNGSLNGETQVFIQDYHNDAFNNPLYFVNTGDFLYYNAYSPTTFNSGIVRINSSGTIKEFIPLTGSVFPIQYLLKAGDNLFFRALYNATGGELWKLSLVTSSASDLSHSLALRLYPTFSADGVFHLDYASEPLSHLDIRVFDALGQLAYQGQQSPNAPLYLSTLSSGTYFVHVAAGSGPATVQKVIIGQ